MLIKLPKYKNNSKLLGTLKTQRTRCLENLDVYFSRSALDPKNIKKGVTICGVCGEATCLNHDYPYTEKPDDFSLYASFDEIQGLFDTVTSTYFEFDETAGYFYSTNHNGSSTAELDLQAYNDVDLRLKWMVDSEQGWDKLSITHISSTGGQTTTLLTESGMGKFGGLSISLAKDDSLQIRYTKDGSVDHGEDLARIAIYSINEIEDALNCTIPYRCPTCTDTVSLPDWTHDLVYKEARAATCAQDGYTAHTQCLKCNYTSPHEFYPQNDTHENVSQMDGWLQFLCQEGEPIPQPVIDSVVSHNTFYCDTCGSNWEEESSCESEPVIVRRSAPTCETPGYAYIRAYNSYSGSVGCGHSHPIAALGHDWQDVPEYAVSDEPVSCMQEKLYYKKCNRCAKASEETFIFAYKHQIPSTSLNEAYTISNDQTYPFNVIDEGDTISLESTNGGLDDTSATCQVVFKTTATFDLDYQVSSENNYDWLTITHNGAEILKLSGEQESNIEVSVVPGDNIEISYTKDGSQANGGDRVRVSFEKLYIEEPCYIELDPADAPCTDQDLYCTRCSGLIKAAGHAFANSADLICNNCGYERSEGPVYTITSNTAKVVDYILATSKAAEIPATTSDGYSVTTIASTAFASCAVPTGVIIPVGITTIENNAFSCPVYYLGTDQNWQNVTSNISDSNVYFYSASKVEKEGNYWRYVDGVPTAWPAHVHSYYTVSTVSRTCTDDGYTLKRCSYSSCAKEVRENVVASLGYSCHQINKLVSVYGQNYSYSNATSYPWTITSLTDGLKITSTNKTNSTTADFILTCKRSFTLNYNYQVSSESNWDKLIILHNGSTIHTISGEISGSDSLSVVNGDTVTFRYSKDSSGSSGSDTAIVNILCAPSGYVNVEQATDISNEELAEIYCTSTALYCTRCNAMLKPAGHIYSNPEDAVCNYCKYNRYLLTYTANGDGTCTVTGYDAEANPETELIIPEYSPRNDRVTAIGSGVFSGSNLTSVVIPDGVTSIGSDAFKSSSSLTNVTLPSSLTTISSNAFYGCAFTTIALPATLTTIANGAFQNCSKLTTIELPAALSSIGASGFSSCNKLTSIIIPSSVTTIGANAFYGCSTLSISCVAASKPSGWDSSWNSSNRPVTWGYILPSVGLAFRSNGDGTCAVSGLGSCTDTTIAIPSTSPAGDTVTSIADSAFYNKKTITRVIIPNSVITIDSYAFDDCSNLTSMELGNSVQTINSYAFRRCYRLAEVINKSSLTITAGDTSNGRVGEYASEVHTGSTKLSMQDDFCFMTTSSGTRYLVSYVGSATTITLPTAFNNNSYVIRKYAFAESSLEKLTVNSTNVTLETNAFANTGSTLKNIELTKTGMTTLAANTFPSSCKITHLTLPEGVTSIANTTINTGTVTHVVFPSTMTSINPRCVEACQNLIAPSVVSSHSVYANGSNYIYSKSDYTLIMGGQVTSVSSNIKYIGDYAFYYRKSISQVTLPSSILTIGKYAFAYSSLTKLGSGTQVIGGSVSGSTYYCTLQKIDEYAFYNCSSLTTASGALCIYSTCKFIGRYAFAGCSSVTKIAVKTSSGWYYTSSSTATSGTSKSFSSSNYATNATYLVSTYSSYYWKHN